MPGTIRIPRHQIQRRQTRINGSKVQAVDRVNPNDHTVAVLHIKGSIAGLSSPQWQVGLRMMDSVEIRKLEAARAAVAEIQDGMLIGLGTGTTMTFAIDALAERVAAGLRVATVVTSMATAQKAEALGLRVFAFDTLNKVDLAIDGADEIDQHLRAIKGGGGAMLREKIVAAAAERMVAIVDASKLVTRLGTCALPVEVLPFATGFVSRRIEALGATVNERTTGGSFYRTDQDNVILDCQFAGIAHPKALATALSAIPGMLGHGLFIDEIDAVYVAGKEGIVHLTREVL